jgi:hypothetical protein
MRVMHAADVFFIVLVAGISTSNAAERHWQTGTWKDVGIKRDPRVGGQAGEGTPEFLGATRPAKPVTPEVGIYVIETPTVRFELEDTAPIGRWKSFDSTVTVGASVTFAVDKNVAYIRNADGTEHRLRITKKITKGKQ